MTRHQRELERRRLELVGRSAAQRAAIAGAVAPFTDKLAIIDRVGATLRRYPIAVSAIAGGVALLGSRGILSWVTRALAVYSLFRKI
jgi:hypothetical protein